MSSSDFNPAFATAAETAGAVRRKRISASELLNATFQRIELVWEDGTSIEFAALLSDVVGGFTAPPAFQE